MYNIEKFDLAVGEVLAHLYKQFPVPSTLDVASFARRISRDEDVQFVDSVDWNWSIASHTIEWLAESGFIRFELCSESRSGFTGVVLAAKGLEILKAVPKSISTDKTVGEILIGNTKEVLIDGAKDIANEGAQQLFRDGVKFVLAQGALALSGIS